MPLKFTKDCRVAPLLLLFLGGLELPGRNEKANEVLITIQDVRVGPPADVELKFRGPDEGFIPSCGTAKNGMRLLCTAATQLEVRTRDGWRLVRLRRTFGILGAIPLSQAEINQISSGREMSFIYRFSRRFFEVDPGQELRVQLQVWHDKKGIASGQGGLKIISPPFKCPEMRVSE